MEENKRKGKIEKKKKEWRQYKNEWNRKREGQKITEKMVRN